MDYESTMRYLLPFSLRLARKLRAACALLCLLFLAFNTGAQTSSFLRPEQAFKAELHGVDARHIELRFSVAKGYYLYRDKFRFTLKADDERTPLSLRLGTPKLPQGEEKQDESFGKTQVYHTDVLIDLPLEALSIDEQSEAGAGLNKPQAATLTLTFQGCAEAGICYLPQQQSIALVLPAQDGATNTAPTSSTSSTSSTTQQERAQVASDSNQPSVSADPIVRLLAKESFWWVVLSFFGFGLLLSLTPCVFPMIPILSGIIVGQPSTQLDSPVAKTHARRRSFTLSLAYVIGMALSYALAGVGAGLSGTLLSVALQNVWVLGAFSLVFVLLALAMFGFYDLQLPTYLQSKLADESNQLAHRISGKSLFGVALMGALSALIVGPCVAAPLAGALLYISQTGDAWLGGVALFCMAIGMGMPLLAIGVSAGQWLPKSGPWMEAVKKALGVVLLATALWTIAPLMPTLLLMLAWALLLIVSASYLHALDPLPANSKAWLRFWKGIGVVLLIVGAALLIGALAGGRDPLQPLLVSNSSAKRNTDTADTATLGASTPHFVRVTSLAELKTWQANSSKPLALDFYADWCVSCQEMARFTFSDARVQQKLQEWTVLQVDVTAGSSEDRAFLKKFNLFGPPALLFFQANGEEIAAARLIGFHSADSLLATLAKLNPS